MKRLAFALTALVVTLAVSSCAVGVRQTATDITDTSATLNGKVLSTTGGSGSWFIEYGPTEDRTERTPTTSIDFTTNTIYPVSEAVDELEPGTTYHFAVCAEDSENPGDPFCSPDQTFRTDYDPIATLTEDCSLFPGTYGVRPSVTGLPPNTSFTARLELPDGSVVQGSVSSGSDGTWSYSPFYGSVAGTWTGTVTWSGGTVVTSLFVDCVDDT